VRGCPRRSRFSNGITPSTNFVHEHSSSRRWSKPCVRDRVVDFDIELAGVRLALLQMKRPCHRCACHEQRSINPIKAEQNHAQKQRAKGSNALCDKLCSPSIALKGFLNKNTVCFQCVHKLCGPVLNETGVDDFSFSYSLCFPFKLFPRLSRPTGRISPGMKLPSGSCNVGTESVGTSEPPG